MAQEKGMIDLGRKIDNKTSPMMEEGADEKGVSYPALYISDVDSLDNLPDGDFTFTAVGRVISHTESERGGERHCSCEIEIKSIKPDGMKKPKSKSTEDSLDESFTKIEKDKEDAADEEDPYDESE